VGCIAGLSLNSAKITAIKKHASTILTRRRAAGRVRGDCHEIIGPSPGTRAAGSPFRVRRQFGNLGKAALAAGCPTDCGDSTYPKIYLAANPLGASMQFTAQTLADTEAVMDGNVYLGCTFERCKMIYRGGGIPHIADCRFEECTWQFEEAAERTILFMKLLYHGMGENGPQLVESAITMIREPLPDKRPG
jgi:hypothetical protein